MRTIYSDLTVEQLRAMTGDERVRLACELTHRELQYQRQLVREEYPQETEAEIDRRFRARMMEFNEKKTAQEVAIATAIALRGSGREGAIPQDLSEPDQAEPRGPN